VLEAWYPGQEAGNAIADVLTGIEPGGRLSQSFPVRWNDNPVHSQDREIYPGLNGKVRYEEGVFIGYRHYDRQGITPLFPFGFGLSYTSFELSAPRLSKASIGVADGVTVSVDVTNTGRRRGDEVVQLYIRDDISSVTRPVKELKGFARVTLAPGEKRTVDFAVTPAELRFFGLDMKRVVEPGTFTIMAGPNSVDLKSTTLTVVAG